MRWVVQSNLTNASDSDRIREACLKHGHECGMVKVTPFSEELPTIPSDQPTVFYGATNFINNVYQSRKWNPGTFFNAENFTIRAYMGQSPV